MEVGRVAGGEEGEKVDIHEVLNNDDDDDDDKMNLTFLMMTFSFKLVSFFISCSAEAPEIFAMLGCVIVMG